MTLIQKDIPVPELREILKTDNSRNAEADAAGLVAEADAQDEKLWEREFANSQDTLSRLAAQSRAHRAAGRTKKIGS